MSPSPTTTAMPTMNGGPRRNSTEAHASSASRRSQEKSFHESGVGGSIRRPMPDATRLATGEEKSQTPGAARRHVACGCTVRLKKGGPAMLHRNERLTVEVRLLPDPCLWCWEIRDAQRDE